MHDWARLIRDVADFPKPGIVFKDITPLLADAQGFASAIQALAEPWRDAEVETVCAIEARGFILGAALALELGSGFVPLRKATKLPAATVGIDYQLEYGMDRLEAHVDAVVPGARALIVDDVLATGGTLAAAQRLVEHMGAAITGASVLVELKSLGGRARWTDAAPLMSVLRFA